MSKNVSLVLIGLLIGCAAGVASDRRVLAQTFPQPTTVHPWQQYCQRVMSVGGANDVLRTAGEQGWELAAVNEGVVCFKRPAQ